MRKYKIEKGVPILETRGTRTEEYPFRDLEIGDSFLIPSPSSKEKQSILSQAYNRGKKLNRRFVTRTVPEGLRVWRVE